MRISFQQGLTSGRRMARLYVDRAHCSESLEPVDVVIEYICAGRCIGRNCRLHPAVAGWGECS